MLDWEEEKVPEIYTFTVEGSDERYTMRDANEYAVTVGCKCTTCKSNFRAAGDVAYSYVDYAEPEWELRNREGDYSDSHRRGRTQTYNIDRGKYPLC